MLPPDSDIELLFNVPAECIDAPSLVTLARGRSCIALLPPQHGPVDVGTITLTPIHIGVAAARQTGAWRITNWSIRLPATSPPRRVGFRSDLAKRFRPLSGKVYVLQPRDVLDTSTLSVGMELGSVKVPVDIKVIRADRFTNDDITWFDYDKSACHPVTIETDALLAGHRIMCVVEGVESKVTLVISGEAPGGVLWLWPGKYEIKSAEAATDEFVGDIDVAAQRFEVLDGPGRVDLVASTRMIAVRMRPIDEVGRPLRKWYLRGENKFASQSLRPSSIDGLIRLHPNRDYVLEADGRVPTPITTALLAGEVEYGAELLVPTVAR